MNTPAPLVRGCFAFTPPPELFLDVCSCTCLGMHMPNAEHLNTRQVAARIGKDESTVNRYVRQGKLRPTFQFPGLRGARLFDPAEVERFAATLEAAQ